MPLNNSHRASPFLEVRERIGGWVFEHGENMKGLVEELEMSIGMNGPRFTDPFSILEPIWCGVRVNHRTADCC